MTSENHSILVESLERDIHELEGRDLQLWSIGLLVMLVIAAGFVALILPNVIWGERILRVERGYLPQLFFGFISLIVLFNIYALQQRWELRRTREELVRQIVRSEAAERLSLIDPLTQTFNRRYLERLLEKEVSRANRHKSGLGFLMIDVDNFKGVNTRFGHLVGDRVLVEVANVLKKVFRASDTLLRYGGDEFLVVLGDSDESQVQHAVQRLLNEVERWNRANLVEGYTMSLSCGSAAYFQGANIEEILQLADQKMYLDKSGHALRAKS